jgi:uncharacterized protein
MGEIDLIVRTVVGHYPTVQAIYLYGSWDTVDEWPDSDLDIALLLSPHQTREAGSLALSNLGSELEASLKKDVDLINLRQVPTVLQKEVIAADRRIYVADEYAANEFEMLVISYYQKLNEERRDILNAFYRTMRAYDV